jgi:hypothetical protein
MAFPGESILLRDGRSVLFAGVDTESGRPIVEMPGAGLIAIDPVLIQEGWRGD